MIQLEASIQVLITQLSNNNTIITVNQRLAALIRQAYDQTQLKQGAKTWPSIQILPLTNWLYTQWEQLKYQLANYKTILNSTQELAIWKKIIATHDHNMPHLQREQTALTVQQAWYLLNHWQLSLSQLTEYHNEQISYFIEWATAFTKYCHLKTWLTSAELPAQLTTSLQQHSIQLFKDTQALFFVGFDELSPAIQQLTAVLDKQVSVTLFNITHTTGICQRLAVDNTQQEITTFASWAAELIQQSPKIKIGCIVPNLSVHRHTIVNELTNTFAIQHKLFAYLDQEKETNSTAEFIYNISAGQSLIEFEVIYIAMQILQLLEGQFCLETIGLLLQSPYLMHKKNDSDLGALLDYSLREHNHLPKLPLNILINHINRFKKTIELNINNEDFKNFSHFKHRWKQFYQAYQQQPTYCLPSEWAHYFEQQLKRLGWPGCRQRNSLEFQLMQKWQQLLGEITYLDSIYPSMSLSEALQSLQSLATQTIFQAQGNPHASIQILGILESVGYQFDALWIMDLHDENWPPPTNPNPFLPYELQQQLEMPHASAARQLKYTQQMNQRLLQSAPSIILSYPLRDGEKVLRPSKLIEQYPLISLTELPRQKIVNYTQLIYESRQLENMIDEKAPRISEKEILTGGSSILTEQALCPFRAFASKRLRAKSLPDLIFAFSHQHRGILLHQALAILWSQLKSQEHLQKLSSDVINTLIDDTLDQAIKTTFNRQQRKLLTSLIDIEKQCTHKLILKWLELEKQRPPFKVIACEQQQQITIGDLILNIQIDRIDELKQGSQMIIDYKTSAELSIQSWLHPLTQAQLPLYSLLPNSFFTAITYAQIRADAISFKGLCSEEHPNPLGDLKGIVTVTQLKTHPFNNWNELHDFWQHNLISLAENFSLGDASVRPLQGPYTCQQCHLHHLCRINMDPSP